ncbi:MAG: C40 family peptidase [Pedobacter sp.]|jgi:cell wall-associated NlpC family hydrolase|uniref:C40 family peptidase n=1 Tax=Pedobacter sp. TaxID=1411316 RepID=UPI00356921E2
MKKFLTILSFILFFTLTSKAQETKSLPKQYQEAVTGILGKIPDAAANQATQIMDFAKSLLGVRYKYASSSPERGFDCSGFVSYVFKNFGFTGARSSRDFAKQGKQVALNEAKVGDVLVFTGTNAKLRTPGHVGIIYSIDEDGKIKFIHASSGKAHGVTVTDLEGYYKTRLLKAVTVLE